MAMTADGRTDLVEIYGGWYNPNSTNGSHPNTFQVAQYDTRPRTGGRLYAEQDADDNVTSLTDAAGVVVERYAYDPYGTVTVENPDGTTRGDGTAASSSYGWAYLHQGLRLDVATGTYDDRNRVYLVSLGRFAQEDPAGYVNGLNRYQLEMSSPVSNVDPTGLFLPAPVVTLAGGPVVWITAFGSGVIYIGVNNYYILPTQAAAAATEAAAATPSRTPAQNAAQAAAAAADKAAANQQTNNSGNGSQPPNNPGAPASGDDDESDALRNAAKAARGYQNLECDKAADNIERELTKAGKHGQRIEIKTNPTNQKISSGTYDGHATAITDTGYHVGVQVGDTVFDNLHPNKIPYNQWVNGFEAPRGVNLNVIRGRSF